MVDKEVKLTVRCVGTEEHNIGKVRKFSPNMAFNPVRMKQIGFVIDDPEVDAKRAIWENKPAPTNQLNSIDTSLSKNMREKSAVEKILLMESVDEIKAFVKDEVRKIVLEVSDNQIQKLTKKSA